MRTILLTALLLLAAGAGPGQSYAGQQYETRAKITLAHARARALRARPGTIADQELEYEGGGLRYSFDVKWHGKVFEVGIDARTGRILENKKEGPNPD